MIVLLHGALGSASQLEPIKSRITADEVSILEFAGHGNTPDTNAPWTIETCADQLEQFLDGLVATGKTPINVFGYSMGGYVALVVALRRPELITRILTLGTKLDWSVEYAQKEILKLNPDVIAAKVPAYAEDLQRRHGSEHWKTVLSKTAQLMTTLGSSPLTSEHVTKLSTLVRFQVGDRDEMVSIEETITFYRATPNAELVVLPKTRHPIERLNLRLLDEQMNQFFAQA